MSRCLEVDKVAKHYGCGEERIHALDDITFDVHHKEFVCIIGPSGCGKSTLLKIIAGLDKPTSGEVRLLGEPVSKPHPKVGMVFQSFALFPWRTVTQNIEFGLEVQGVPKEKRRLIGEELVEMIGLRGHENSYPRELSGGMKQRVGMARALAVNPEIVLMDEAFSAVDEFTAQVLRSEVVELWEETAKTFVLVTHNLTEAIEMADRIIVLSARPAKMKQAFPVNLKRPRNRADSKFMRCQKDLFSLLKDELENTIIRHKLRAIHKHKHLDDIELDHK